MISPEKATDWKCVEEVLPKLGMVYGIIMQARNKELNLVQRILSLALTESLCDVKVG